MCWEGVYYVCAKGGNVVYGVFDFRQGVNSGVGVGGGGVCV